MTPNELLLDAAKENNMNNIISAKMFGADIDYSEWADKRTALMFAAKYGYTECVALLLSYGASINTTDIFGNTALYYARQSRNDEIILMISKQPVKPPLSIQPIKFEFKPEDYHTPPVTPRSLNPQALKARYAESKSEGRGM